MNTGMTGVYMLHGFVAISLVIGIWKLIGIALDQFRYWNNHD